MARPAAALLALFGVLALLAPPAAAAGLLVPRDGSPPIAVKSHRVVAVVEDGLARTTLRQTFVNPHRRELEAVYVFPVPEGAALVDVAMETGGKRFEGLLAERKRARRIYDDIVRRQRDPALVEQIGRSTFRLSVYPVLPAEETVVELTWIQHLPLTQGIIRYVYPLSLVSEKAARVQQDFTFTVTLRSSVPFEEAPRADALPKGTEIIKRSSREYVASFEKIRARLRGDIEVSAVVEVAEPTLTVATYRRETGDGWFTAVVTPPKAGEEDLIPRDVLLLLDTSGSMRGEKILQAKRAALYLLSHLRPGDRVNLIRFSSSMQAYAKEPVPANLESVAKLTDFVNAITARGGTALGDAVESLTGLPEAKGRVRTAVFITDGLPTVGETNPARIVAFAKAAGAKGLRIFTFGVGRDVDPALLAGIARASRGRAEVFGPEAQLEARLRIFLDRTASPVIADIALEVSGAKIYDVFPRPVPDAYLGEQVVLTGRYRGGGDCEVAVTATVGRKGARLAKKLVFRKRPGGSPAVAQLGAISHLRFLEEALRLRLGLADDAYYAALDRGAYSTRDEIVAEMIRVSLDHGVQCAYTAFLVLLPEDRHRLDPRNRGDVTAALERASRARRELAPESREPPSAPDEEAGDLAGGAGEAEPEEDGYGVSGSSGGEPGAGLASGVPGRPLDGRDNGGRPGKTPAPSRPSGGAGPGTPGPGRHQGTAPEPGPFPARSDRASIPRDGVRARTESAVDRAIGYLARSQREDGRWTSGNGDTHDVGVTGLALLAILGAGEKPAGTKRSHLVVRGLSWLMAQQDADGCFGTRHPEVVKFTYNHAIATRAVVEAYGVSRSAFLRRSAQRGLDFILKCQNPYLAWRYGMRPQDNDTSVSAWMLMALKAGKMAGLEVDPRGFEGMRAWLDKVTEPEYGRAGYTARGTGPARPSELMERFPADKSESLTAEAVLCRILIGEEPQKSEMIQKGVDLCLKAPPVWDEAAGSIDMYYWYFGTLALFQVGGKPWEAWRDAIYPILADRQHLDGDQEGSWDPVGPWGPDGGRVYATALMAMCLQAEYLYPRFFRPLKGGKRGRPGRVRLR